MTPLSEWAGFYSVVGTAAASLTGLQFVMMALLTDMPRSDGVEDAGNAFGAPTVVHFSAVLLVTAVAVMPWHSLPPAGILLAGTGVAGLVYTAVVIQRMRRQTAYAPVVEDWIFHALLPLVAYALLAGEAAFLAGHPRPALFTTAAAALLLLFTGVHNAWDSAAYIVFTRHRRTDR